MEKCELLKEYSQFVSVVRAATELAREDGFEVGLKEGTKVGIQQGIQQGAERINQLNSMLIENGRIEDLKKAAQDTSYQEMLFKEFDI